MIRNMQILYKPFIILALTIVIVSCGTNVSQRTSTGAITAQLAWNATGKTTAKTVASAPAGVTTVRIIVSAADITTIQMDFTAASGSGTIDGVTPGTGRSLTAQGLNGTGVVIYQGTVANLTVQAGQTTNAETVTMAAVGAAPKLSFDVTALTFGPQDNFTTSAAQTVTLTNSGNTDIFLYDDFITFPQFAQFGYVSNNCPYQPLIFASGAICTISINFSPIGQDTLRSNYSLQQQLGGTPSPIPQENYSGAFAVHGYSVTNPQIAIPKLSVILNGIGAYPPTSPTVTTPAITGISPTSGAAGTTVTITGTNFSNTPANNTVKFNGTLATVTSSTSSTLTITVPASATTGTVSVTTTGGTATSTGNFTVSTPYTLSGTWEGTWQLSWTALSSTGKCTQNFMDGGAISIVLKQNGPIDGFAIPGNVTGTTNYADGVQGRNDTTCVLVETYRYTGGSITAEAGGVTANSGAIYFTNFGIGSFTNIVASANWDGDTIIGTMGRTNPVGKYSNISGTLRLFRVK